MIKNAFDKGYVAIATTLQFDWLELKLCSPDMLFETSMSLKTT
jgi:predicted nucleotidyltransferase